MDTDPVTQLVVFSFDVTPSFTHGPYTLANAPPTNYIQFVPPWDKQTGEC